MNLTKLFQFEKKQKSRLYKEVEYLVTNYDLIKSFYSTYAYIQSTKFIYAGKGSYLSYVIKYEDENSNTHIKELDGFFTIRNLIAGDKIKININKNNPNNITVAYSDLIVAIILCVIGIVFESIIIVVYVLAH